MLQEPRMFPVHDYNVPIHDYSKINSIKTLNYDEFINKYSDYLSKEQIDNFNQNNMFMVHQTFVY